MGIQEWFWPIRTGETFFDVWSIVHFCTFLGFGATLQATKLPLWAVLLILLTLGFGWEVVERYVPFIHMHVKNPESWLNSWISDPIIDMLGGGVGIWLIMNWD